MEKSLITAFIIRLVTMLIIYVLQINDILKIFLLVYVSDFIDGFVLRFIDSSNKKSINNSYQYHLWDKILDFIGNVLGLLIIIKNDYITDTVEYLKLSLFIRSIGIFLFLFIKSSYVWVVFPDLIKELIIARLVFNRMNIGIFCLVLVIKCFYEYYHHFIKNKRDFD